MNSEECREFRADSTIRILVMGRGAKLSARLRDSDGNTTRRSRPSVIA